MHTHTHTCTSNAFCTELGNDLDYGPSARTKHYLKLSGLAEYETALYHACLALAPRGCDGSALDPSRIRNSVGRVNPPPPPYFVYLIVVATELKRDK